jgi:hypothetical protein
MQREWTGSCANLAESMEALAVKFANRANETGDSFLQDEAYTLSEWADAIRELYARLDADEPHTNAQGVAISRRITERTERVEIFPRPFDLPEGYLLATFHDRDAAMPFVCGIAPDGSVSS